MIRSIKVRLNPNNKQFTKLFQYAGCARFAYNWAISREEENHKQVINSCQIWTCEKNSHSLKNYKNTNG